MGMQFLFLQILNLLGSPRICLFKTEKCTNSSKSVASRTTCDNHCNQQYPSFTYIVNKSFGVNALEFWDRRFMLASTPLEFQPAADLDSSLANYNIIPLKYQALVKTSFHHLFIYLLAPIFWPRDSKPKSCHDVAKRSDGEILNNITNPNMQCMVYLYLYVHMYHKNWPLMWVNIPYPPQSLI